MAGLGVGNGSTFGHWNPFWTSHTFSKHLLYRIVHTWSNTKKECDVCCLELLYKSWNINLINICINMHRQVSQDIFLVLRKDQTFSYLLTILLFMPFSDILGFLDNLLAVSSLQSKYFCWCCRWLGLFPKRNVVVLCQLYGEKMLAAWKKENSPVLRHSLNPTVNVFEKESLWFAQDCDAKCHFYI